MKKYLFRIAVILILLLAVFVYWRFYFVYSNGYRSGLLQKFSYKGTLFKTYEGEMILSSIRSNMNAPIASEKFLFSVHEDKVARSLELLQGQMVTVHYKYIQMEFYRGAEKALTLLIVLKLKRHPFNSGTTD